MTLETLRQQAQEDSEELETLIDIFEKSRLYPIEFDKSYAEAMLPILRRAKTCLDAAYLRAIASQMRKEFEGE